MRGAWRLVAARDFWVRLRERSFVISTGLNIAVISILVLLRSFSTGTASYELGVVGDERVRSVAEGAATLGQDAGIRITVVALADGPAADAALRAGTVDAVLSRGQLVGFRTVDGNLQALVQASERNERITALLDRHDISQAERDEANNPEPLRVAVLQVDRPSRSADAGVAFVMVLLLYGQLFGYGVWVATGVIEEKSSRVVEMLLSAIRPTQLLAGKILGIGALGLAQLAVIAGFAVGLASITNAISVPSSALYGAALVVFWFILGFAFYATLFAAAGSLVTRMEELQNVIVPINLTILVSFIISIGALQDPNSPLAIFASILPFSAPLAMPVRIVLGAATAWQVALSLTLLIGSAIFLVPVGARLYRGAVLRTGQRVRLRDAWAAG